MYIKDIYEHRNILVALVKKNLFGRYNNSRLGFMWHFLSPLLQIALYYFVLGSFTEMGEVYWVFLTISIFPFIFLQSNIPAGASSIIGNADILKKIYFPREILTLSCVISNCIVFLFSYSVALVFLQVTNVGSFFHKIPILIFITALMFIFAYGVSLLLATLTSHFHDIQQVIDVSMRVFFWITPVFAPITSFPLNVSNVMYLNPFTYYIIAFQDTLYYDMYPSQELIGVCFIIAIVFYVVGHVLFNKYKNKFVELL